MNLSYNRKISLHVISELYTDNTFHFFGDIKNSYIPLRMISMGNAALWSFRKYGYNFEIFE